MNRNLYDIDDVSKLPENNSHTIIVDFVKGQSPILDVGCSNGFLGKLLKPTGVSLTGIEIDNEEAEKASPYYEKILTGDAADSEVLSRLDDLSFSAIVLGDIVEHLQDPWTFLRNICRKLADGGMLIVSIPNLGHASVVATLLSGSFQYRDVGLLDSTHIRFFSLRSLIEMLMEAGLKPVEVRRVVHGTFETELPILTTALPTAVIPAIEQCSEAATYQFVVKAVKGIPEHTLDEYAAMFSLRPAEKDRDEEINKYLDQLATANKELREARIFSDECLATIATKDADLNTQKKYIDECLAAIASKDAGLNTQKKYIDECLATIASKDADLNTQKKYIDECLAAIASKDAGLNTQKKYIDECLATIASKDADLNTQKEYIDECLAAIASKDADLNTQKEYIDECLAAIASKDSDLNTQKKYIDECLAAIAAKDADLNTQKEYIDECLAAIASKDSDLNTQKEYIDECLAVIATKDADLNTQKEYIDECLAAIATKDAEIAGKDADLKAQKENIDECLAVIAAKDAEIASKDSDLIAQETLIKERDALRKMLSSEIQKNNAFEKLLPRLSVNPESQPADQKLSGKNLDIIIPIYNSFDEVRACLHSVAEHTDARHSIIVVNDASTDRRIAGFLRNFIEGRQNFTLRSHETNMGYLKTVNESIALSTRDVVLLNSDTVVTKGWAEKILLAAESDPKVGALCPLSNNATIMSVPNMNTGNHIPSNFSIDRFGELIQDCSARSYPLMPTVVGFCMYISRKCINEIGLFDEAFGMGYGEENDFVLRARQNGYNARAVDDTYVFHSGSTSFATAEGNLDERKLSNERMLGERWPQYHREIFSFCVMNPLRGVQQRIQDRILKEMAGDKPQVFKVIHSYNVNAGTELHARLLVTNLKNIRFTVMYPSTEFYDTDAHSNLVDNNVMEMRYNKRHLAASEYFYNGQPAGLRSSVVESNFESIIRGSDAQAVHFHHMLMYGTFMMPFIARSLGRKVLFTMHDYFMLCPSYNLLLPNGVMCCKNGLDSGDDDCIECLKQGFKTNDGSMPDTQTLKRYAIERKKLAHEALINTDVIITPSVHMKMRITTYFGDGLSDKIRVMPHGVAVPIKRKPQEPSKKLRVTFLGNATLIKGFHIFGSAAGKVDKKKVVMQSYGDVMGNLGREHGQRVSMKGPYGPGDLEKIMSTSDLVVIPSIWEETFCYTLSEALAYGVPVVASDIGAISERIEDGKNGFLFPVANAERLAEIITTLADSPDKVNGMKAYCLANPPYSLGESMEDYRTLYGDILD